MLCGGETQSGNIALFRSGWYFEPRMLWTMYRLHSYMLRETNQLIGRRFGLDSGKFVTFYTRHCGWVRKEAQSRGRLVVEWRVADGWTPLCEALGKDVPNDLPPFLE